MKATLKITTDNLAPNAFRVTTGRRTPHACTLRHFSDGSLEIMQRPSVLSGGETAEETAARLEFNASQIFQDGDTVEVEGFPGVFTLKVRGNYSDLGYLIRKA